MARHVRVFTTLIALTALAVPTGAFAQQTQPADSALPSYASAAPSYGAPGETISGRIVSFDGQYSLQVRDDRGFIDNVQLQPGTVINPTGLRLAAGMAVTIHGVNRGNVFGANEIDTPYQSYGAAYPYPYPVYPYAAYPYPYPVYPYPVYGYPYGPRVSIGIGFGFHGRWR
jgi:hypothetical protein